MKVLLQAYSDEARRVALVKKVTDPERLFRKELRRRFDSHSQSPQECTVRLTSDPEFV